MELSYWRSKWRKGQTGFHMKNGYPGLEKHWNSIQLKNPVVLVPLCGKSKDLVWLSKHSERVVGVEISDLAVEQFLEENSLDAQTSTFAGFTIYHTGNMEVWNGDFFKLPIHKLPSFDLIYDRASLVALPPDMRKEYAKKILELISNQTQILLHQFYYPQEEMPGPPFSVSPEELETLYGEHFNIQILEKNELMIDSYKKFRNRGLQSFFIEILSLLLPKVDKTTK